MQENQNVIVSTNAQIFRYNRSAMARNSSSCNPRKRRGFELSQQSMILPPSLTRILKNLEEDGLIKRATYKQDQRKVLINLTAKGEKNIDKSFLNRKRFIDQSKKP
ncbi:MAG: hypothetical protein CM1200mP40_04580 [Gammaproteobacteria bacterium]|nr:MAG: hypothetical protein CM1200mP40_04580 [Gammaproteobacteria bacterium]